MQTQFRELSDSQWQVVQKIIGPQRASKHSARSMVNALLWLVRTGCQWRNLDSRFPPWSAVYYRFRQWQHTGQWARLLAHLVQGERQRQGRSGPPGWCVLDSQSIKTSARIAQGKGLDPYKRIKGRKRHLLVEETGLPLALRLTAASRGDSKAAEPLLSHWAASHGARPVLLVDAVYPHTFVSWAQQTWHWPVDVMSKPAGKGFVAQPRRWVVERSFGWLSWYRRLSVEYEKTVASAEAMLQLAFISILLNRIT
jgi:putative transposase